jgi:hypothetical protein
MQSAQLLHIVRICVQFPADMGCVACGVMQSCHALVHLWLCGRLGSKKYRADPMQQASRAGRRAQTAEGAKAAEHSRLTSSFKHGRAVGRFEVCNSTS